MPLVVTREALVLVEVGPERRVIRFDLAGTVVAVLRQLVVREEEQTRRVTLLEAQRQTLEIRRSYGG